MKKLTSLILLSVIPLTLASCGLNNEKTSSTTSSSSKSEKIAKATSSKKDSTKKITKSEGVKILNANGYSAHTNSAKVTKSTNNQTVIKAQGSVDQQSKSIYTLTPHGKDQVKIEAQFGKQSSDGSFKTTKAPSGLAESKTVDRSTSKSSTNTKLITNMSREEITNAESQNGNQPLSDEPIKNADQAINLLTQHYGDQGWQLQFNSIGKSSPIYYHIMAKNGRAFYVYATGSIQSADGDLSAFSDKIGQ